MNVRTRMMAAAVVVLVALAVARAANYRFREAESAFQQACGAELRKLGVSRGDAKAKYPTPFITSVSSGCLLPGQTAEVVVKGKFAPGTRFFFENDNLQTVKEALVGGEYRATVKAAPGIGPQTADLRAVSPVTCINALQQGAVAVGGRYEWRMEAANGWRIEARSTAGGACGGTMAANQFRRPGAYDLLFYRAGESAPFEKRRADLQYSLWNRANYAFSVKEGADPGNPHEAFMKKLTDPNLPDAERQRLMQDMMKIQQEMMASMKKMADPAYIKAQQEKKLQFGCDYIEMEVAPGAANFTGRMRCSEKVGRQIALNGSMKLVGQ